MSISLGKGISRNATTLNSLALDMGLEASFKAKLAAAVTG